MYSTQWVHVKVLSHVCPRDHEHLNMGDYIVVPWLRCMRSMKTVSYNLHFQKGTEDINNKFWLGLFGGFFPFLFFPQRSPGRGGICLEIMEKYLLAWFAKPKIASSQSNVILDTQV